MNKQSSFFQDLIRLDILYKAKYIILFFFIFSIIINFYISKNFKTAYRLESFIYYNNVENFRELHLKLKEYKRAFYDKIDIAGYENTDGETSGNIFKKLYSPKYNEFIELFLMFTIKEYPNYFRSSKKASFPYDNKFEQVSKDTNYSLNDPLFLVELYDYDKKKVQKDFEKSLRAIELSYKKMINQTIVDIRYEIDAFINYNKQKFEAVTLGVSEEERDLDFEFKLNYMLNIVNDIELIESSLINYLNGENVLINDEIQYRIITKDYPFYVYLVYMFLVSVILASIIQFILNLIKNR